MGATTRPGLIRCGGGSPERENRRATARGVGDRTGWRGGEAGVDRWLAWVGDQRRRAARRGAVRAGGTGRRWSVGELMTWASPAGRWRPDGIRACPIVCGLAQPRSMGVSKDGNGDPIPDSPRGIPLLGDGDGNKFVPTGN